MATKLEMSIPNIEKDTRIILTRDIEVIKWLADIGGYILSRDEYESIAPVYACMFSSRPEIGESGKQWFTPEEWDLLKKRRNAQRESTLKTT